MMHTRSWFSVLTIVGLLAPIVVLSTPPPPLPCHWFQFEGQVVVDGGGSPQNYTVVVVGKGGKMVVGEWRIARSNCVDTDYGSASDLALTGTDGKFYLSVWTRYPPDSLAVGVVSPDSLILGEPTLRSDLTYSTIEKTASHEEAGSGCDDGTTVETSYVSAYAYRTVEGVTIAVPQ